MMKLLRYPIIIRRFPSPYEVPNYKSVAIILIPAASISFPSPYEVPNYKCVV